MIVGSRIDPSSVSLHDYGDDSLGSISGSARVDARLVLTDLQIDRFNHIGHGLEFLFAGQDAVDRLAGLALGMTDREERGVGVANHVGLGVLGRAVGIRRRRRRGSRADDQGELADLAAQLGDDPLGGRLADAGKRGRGA